MKPWFPEFTARAHARVLVGALAVAPAPAWAIAVTLMALLAPLAAGAAPRGVEAFDAGQWRALQATLKQPTVVVFSATWCPNCPAVIEELAQDLRERGLAAPLLVVVMDVAPGEADAKLLRQTHYRVADRLFAFAGPAPALRYGVDPAWRGVTPFVALLKPGAPPRLVSGPPADEDLDAWARAAPPPARKR